MVDDQHQHMQVGGRPQQPGPHRDLQRGQVERLLRGLRHRTRQVLLARRGGLQPPARLGRGQHLLVRLAVGGREHGAQHLVPADHVGQRRLQRGDVQVAVQPQRHRDVVDRRRALELADEPQPLLGERQRHPVRPHPGRHRQPGRARRGQHRGQPGRGRRLEHGPDRHLGAQHRPDPGRQPHRQQRMPAQGEEIIVGPDPVHPEHARRTPRTAAPPPPSPAPAPPPRPGA